MVGEIRSKRLRWVGHILRQDAEQTPRTIYESVPEGKRPIGRPKARWKDQIQKDMRRMGLSEEDAGDREKWRQAVGEAKYQLGYKWPWQ